MVIHFSLLWESLVVVLLWSVQTCYFFGGLRQSGMLCHGIPSCTIMLPLAPWGFLLCHEVYSCAMHVLVAPCMFLLRHGGVVSQILMCLCQNWSHLRNLYSCCTMMEQDGPSWSLMSQVCMKSSIMLKIVQGCSEVGIAQELHHVVPPWWMLAH